MKTLHRIALSIAAVNVVAVTSAAPAGAAETPAANGNASGAASCARKFDTAVEQYVTTTHQRDTNGFVALLDRRVTAILANGGVLDGKQATADFIRDFFADPAWTQSFTVLKKVVNGCNTGFVLFDSVYSPDKDTNVPLVIGVTYTYRDGHWLVLHNQDSNGPSS